MSDSFDEEEVLDDVGTETTEEAERGVEVILTHAFQPESDVSALLTDIPTVSSPTVIDFCVMVDSGCDTIHVHAPSMALLRLVTRHPSEVSVESAVIVVDVPGEKPDAEYSALVAGVPRVSHSALLAASLQKKGDNKADQGNQDREQELRRGLPEEPEAAASSQGRDKERSRAATRALAELQRQPEFGPEDDLKV